MNIIDKNMNNRIKTLIACVIAASTALFTSCDKEHVPAVEYLDVNPHTLSGSWQLVSWNGVALADGTYMYMNIVRNDRTFTIYQNMDTFMEMPHVVTGVYNIETDVEAGAIIYGTYDHSSGDWSHRYIVKDMTKDSMTWVAKDDPDFVQKFVRVADIPVAE